LKLIREGVLTGDEARVAFKDFRSLAKPWYEDLNGDRRVAICAHSKRTAYRRSK
jgi:hypothetical protein